MSKALLTLSELQQGLQLPDAAVLHLIRSGACRMEISEEDGLLIDPASLEESKLLEAILTPPSELLPQEASDLEARLVRIFSQFLDEILSESLETLNKVGDH